jgi:hypothetical protein
MSAYKIWNHHSTSFTRHKKFDDAHCHSNDLLLSNNKQGIAINLVKPKLSQEGYDWRIADISAGDRTNFSY